MPRHIVKVAMIVFLCFNFALSVHAEHLSVYTLDCPEQYGTIIKRIHNGGDKTVVLLQDAHTDLGVQKNIARLIAYYADPTKDRDSVRLVAVEGAEDYMDYNTYREYPVRSIRERLADEYLELGIFTGAEYAAITGEVAIDLFGAEDWGTFEKNYLTRYRISGTINENKQTIRSMQEHLRSLKVALYKNELFLFDQEAKSFESGTHSVNSFLPVLYGHIKKSGIALIDYPQVSIVFGLVNADMFLDRLQARQEEARLISALGEFIDVSKLKDSGDLERQRFIINACRTHRIPVEEESAFFKLYAYNRNAKAVDTVALLGEIDTINQMIRRQYATSSVAQELIDIDRILTCAYNLAELKATRAEVRFFFENRDAFELERIDSFIRSEARKHGQLLRSDYDTSRLNSFFDTVETFYMGVLARDEKIARNLLDEMVRSESATALLVIGGFHTAGILHALSAHKINAIVVSPQLLDNGSSIDIQRRFFGPLKNIQPDMVGTIQPLRTYVERYKERIEKKFSDQAFQLTLEMIT
jgi:hypothetical protein